MPSMIHVSLNNAEAYDQAVHGPKTVPQASEAIIVTKDAGTESGRAAAVICFDIEINGAIHTAQATFTLRNLIAALSILNVSYVDGFAREVYKSVEDSDFEVN